MPGMRGSSNIPDPAIPAEKGRERFAQRFAHASAHVLLAPSVPIKWPIHTPLPDPWIAAVRP